MLFSFLLSLAVPVVAISAETGSDPQQVLTQSPEWVILSGLSFLAVAGLFTFAPLQRIDPSPQSAFPCLGSD